MNKKNEETNPYDEYRRHAVDNEMEILNSKTCGCFFCRSIYDARKVSDWLSDERGETALCPECGMDAVIGDASGVPLSKPLLREMNLAYFGEDYMEKNPAAVRVYCQRYLDGKITHKPHNEELFTKYCTLLAESGDPAANYTLGLFYSGGSEFLNPDLEKACSYFAAPSLHNDERALCKLGRLYSMKVGKVDNPGWAAYECFAKASALGSLEAVYRLSDLYRDGTYCPKDESFAYEALLEGYDECYADFAVDHRRYDVFPEFAYRLAKCYQFGIGVDLDEGLALRYYLLAALGCNVRSAFEGNGDYENLEPDINAQLIVLAKKFRLSTNQPVFDSDTFFDTYGDPNSPDVAPKKFHFLSYNREDGTLDFEIESSKSFILCDIGNLFCGFGAGKIHWSFEDVADCKVSSQTDFEEIMVTDDQNGWKLVHIDEGGNESNVAEIRFYSHESLKKAFKGLSLKDKKAQKKEKDQDQDSDSDSDANDKNGKDNK